MSLRTIAKELGVSHTLLSLWQQGKRNLSPELEARYHQLVTRQAVTSGYKNGYKNDSERPPKGASIDGDGGEYDGSPSWIRTNDLAVNSRALYRLSYRGMKPCSRR